MPKENKVWAHPSEMGRPQNQNHASQTGRSLSPDELKNLRAQLQELQKALQDANADRQRLERGLSDSAANQRTLQSTIQRLQGSLDTLQQEQNRQRTESQQAFQRLQDQITSLSSRPQPSPNLTSVPTPPASGQTSNRPADSIDVEITAIQARTSAVSFGSSYRLNVDITYTILNKTSPRVGWYQQRISPYASLDTGIALTNIDIDKSDAPLCNSSLQEDRFCDSGFKELPSGLSRHHTLVTVDVYNNMCDLRDAKTVDLNLMFSFRSGEVSRHVRLGSTLPMTGRLSISGCFR